MNRIFLHDHASRADNSRIIVSLRRFEVWRYQYFVTLRCADWHLGTQKVVSSTAALQERPQSHFFKFNLKKQKSLCVHIMISVRTWRPCLILCLNEHDAEFYVKISWVWYFFLTITIIWTDINQWIVSSSVSNDNNNMKARVYFIICLFNGIRENSISFK